MYWLYLVCLLLNLLPVPVTGPRYRGRVYRTSSTGPPGDGFTDPWTGYTVSGNILILHKHNSYFKQQQMTGYNVRLSCSFFYYVFRWRVQIDVFWGEWRSGFRWCRRSMLQLMKVHPWSGDPGSGVSSLLMSSSHKLRLPHVVITRLWSIEKYCSVLKRPLAGDTHTRFQSFRHTHRGTVIQHRSIPTSWENGQW